MKKEGIIIYAKQEIESCKKRITTFKEARKLAINVQQIDEHIRREKQEIDYHNSVIRILRLKDSNKEKFNKRFYIVYCSENLIGRKSKHHYTDNLSNWIYFNKNAWKYYPENYFPIEIYDNKSNELLCIMENIIGVEKCLKALKKEEII